MQTDNCAGGRQEVRAVRKVGATAERVTVDFGNGDGEPSRNVQRPRPRQRDRHGAPLLWPGATGRLAVRQAAIRRTVRRRQRVGHEDGRELVAHLLPGRAAQHRRVLVDVGQRDDIREHERRFRGHDAVGPRSCRGRCQRPPAAGFRLSAGRLLAFSGRVYWCTCPLAVCGVLSSVCAVDDGYCCRIFVKSVVPIIAFSAHFAVHLQPSQPTATPMRGIVRNARGNCVRPKDRHPRDHRTRSQDRRPRRSRRAAAHFRVLRDEHLWRATDAGQAAARDLQQTPRRRSPRKKARRRHRAARRAGREGVGDQPRGDALHTLVPAADRTHRRKARRFPFFRRRAADGVVRSVAAHPE